MDPVKTNRPLFIGLTLCAMLAGTAIVNPKKERCTSTIISRVTDDDFMAAKNDRDKRAIFLHRFSLDHSIGRGTIISYDEEFTQYARYIRTIQTRLKNEGVTYQEDQTDDETRVPAGVALFGRWSSPTIYVSQAAFDRSRTMDELASMIVDHAGHHAIDASQGIAFIDTRIDFQTFNEPQVQFMKTLREARANYHQLKEAVRYRGISSRFMIEVENGAKKYMADLARFAEGTSTIAGYAKSQLREWTDVSVTMQNGEYKVEFLFNH